MINFPDISQYAQADQAAQDALDQFNQDDARIYTVETQEDGLLPGQLLDIDVPPRDAASKQAIITDVQGTANTALDWEYVITAEESASSLLQADPITDLRRQLGRVA